MTDLLAGPPPTLLPTDPAHDELMAGAKAGDVVRRHPTSPAVWAALVGTARDEVESYAYARVGYHRGLDLLRRSGWKGHGPIPWDHIPNRGFLTCLAVLSVQAQLIGEADEAERCQEFLREASPEGYAQLFQQ